MPIHVAQVHDFMNNKLTPDGCNTAISKLHSKINYLFILYILCTPPFETRTALNFVFISLVHTREMRHLSTVEKRQWVVYALCDAVKWCDELELNDGWFDGELFEPSLSVHSNYSQASGERHRPTAQPHFWHILSNPLYSLLFYTYQSPIRPRTWEMNVHNWPRSCGVAEAGRDRCNCIAKNNENKLRKYKTNTRLCQRTLASRCSHRLVPCNCLRIRRLRIKHI